LYPNNLLNIGYALHRVSRSGRGSNGSSQRAIAEKIVAEFLSLSADEDRDRNYLLGARGIVYAFADGLARAERAYLNAQRRIQDDYSASMARIREERWFERAADFGKKALAPTIFGALAAYLAAIAAPIIPAAIASHTGDTIPVLGAFVGIGTVVAVVQQFWMSYRQERARTRYAMKSQEAERAYQRAVFLEHQCHHQEMMRLWQAYTGHECHEASVYEGVLHELMHASASLGRDLRRKPSVTRQIGLRLLKRLKKK
jgi:hypothetical protein